MLPHGFSDLVHGDLTITIGIEHREVMVNILFDFFFFGSIFMFHDASNDLLFVETFTAVGIACIEDFLW